MKSIIQTNAGIITIEQKPLGTVVMKLKPVIWPELQITLKAGEVQAIREALDPLRDKVTA